MREECLKASNDRKARHGGLRGFLCAVLGTALLSAGAAAQEPWPSKPVRFVVPFAAGGGSDIKARILAEELYRILNTRFVVDNRPGAAGSIGAAVVAKAPADGYTILYGTPGPMITNPLLYKERLYDAEKELDPVIFLFKIPNVLVVHPSVPARSVQELIALAKSRPGTLNFAHTGTGSSSHLAGELLKTAGGIDFVSIPYRGSAPAAQDLIAGAVHMTIDSIAAFAPHYQSGALRVIGVSTLERVPTAPEIPPIADAVPGFEASSITYVAITGGTPKPIVDKLNAALNAILQKPEVIARFADEKVVPVGGSPADLGEVLRQERTKWKRVIELTGLQPE